MSERGVVPMSPTLQQIFFEQYAGRTCGSRAYWDGPAVAVRAMAGNLRVDRPSMRRTRRSPRSRGGVARRLQSRACWRSRVARALRRTGRANVRAFSGQTFTEPQAARTAVLQRTAPTVVIGVASSDEKRAATLVAERETRPNAPPPRSRLITPSIVVGISSFLYCSGHKQ